MWSGLSRRVKILIITLIIISIVFTAVLLKIFYDEAYNSVSMYSLSIYRIVYYRGNMSLHIYADLVFSDNSRVEIVIGYVNAKVYLYIDSERVFLGETIMSAPILKPGLNTISEEIVLALDRDTEKYVFELKNRSSAQIYLVIDYGYSYHTLYISKTEDIYSIPFDPSRITELK